MITNGKSKPRKIAFFGNFNSTNFGNESTLQVILLHLRRFQPDAEVFCICTGPEATTATHQIKAIPISGPSTTSWSAQTRLGKIIRGAYNALPREFYRWIKAFTALRGTHMLIIPGTGLLTDAYGLRGWGPYNIFKWSFVAKMCGCKLLFVSVGAGPVYSTLGRFLVKSTLSLADFRSYRDDTTKQYLESIGFRADNDPVYPDLVFSLPDSVIPHVASHKSGRYVVGLGLMEYAGKYSVINPKDGFQTTYLERMVPFVKWLLYHENEIRLLVGDVLDTTTKNQLRELLRNNISEIDAKHIIDEPVTSVRSLLLEISATDIVVATRFHNVILALLCNKPVIAISFHHKCSSLMNTMGLSQYCLDINNFDTESLIEKFCELEINYSNVKSSIRRRTLELQKTLDSQYKKIFDIM